LLAVGLGRVFGISPLARLQPDWPPFIWGLLATLPLLLALIWILQRPEGRLRGLVDFVVDQLGPMLAGCSAGQLLLLAILAGIGEELLFRGLIQTWLSQRVPNPVSILVASVLFGLVHFATSTYAMVAGVMGLYLGVLFVLQGNLFAPIVTHALYDLVALLLVAQRYRSRARLAMG
jgi:membrane protease YdiL (CAAX protease family)